MRSTPRGLSGRRAAYQNCASSTRGRPVTPSLPKVIWGDEWDELFQNDESGLLVKRMGEAVDGEVEDHLPEGAPLHELHGVARLPRGVLRAAVDRNDVEASKVASVALHCFRHLERQLARRRQH